MRALTRLGRAASSPGGRKKACGATEVVTLTLNPTIDVSFEVDAIRPVHKLRGRAERHDPGGGGINVARVIARLGRSCTCCYLAGGAAGLALDRLLEQQGLDRVAVAIAGETRISTAILDRSLMLQYRFVTEGPEVATDEWRQCLALLADTPCGYIVASGSLPRGVPDDFYAQVSAVAARLGSRFVLDSSGRGLAGGLAGAGVFLVKPSLGELSALVGRELAGDGAIAAAAAGIVARGAAEHVAVTLGAEGAMLVNAGGVLRLPAIATESVGAVGCGDSFLAAMVDAMAGGREVAGAFRFGLAGGAAATLAPGTSLASPADIRRLYAAGAALAR